MINLLCNAFLKFEPYNGNNLRSERIGTVCQRPEQDDPDAKLHAHESTMFSGLWHDMLNHHDRCAR